jgi:hypothetical protein
MYPRPAAALHSAPHSVSICAVVPEKQAICVPAKDFNLVRRLAQPLTRSKVPV